MMGRTTAFPSQFSGKKVRKKKEGKKKKKREIAEGKPENPRADAQRSEKGKGDPAVLAKRKGTGKTGLTYKRSS